MARRGKAAHNRKKGPRTKSGQLSRSRDAKQFNVEQVEKAARETVIAQRVAMGVPEHLAKDHRTGTVQGLLFLMRKIDQDQYNVAEWYLTCRNKYMVAKSSPGAVYDRPEDHVPTGDPQAYVEFCKTAIGRWNALECAILDACQRKGSAAMVGALDVILVRQRLQFELVSSLKDALNALAEIYSGKKRKSAA